MAVPKKKTSKARKRQRKAVWKRQAVFEAQKALSLAKSILTGRSRSFYYPTADEAQEEA
ncbi:MAG: 50S ribosomal protein L32 [Gloeomargarita sp. SKYBB_i_bin120]|nr:50S ribosomal protein L32 [Gloeomargarita sp. SKYG98]MCS7293332.1 50S ribosomal protein L32 [Gloeomargarita sp. SKYB120]MDW8178897.1 50S ribosomal protein L32 [Gloeomargarita sp. SKYBB_i_bin120]